MKAKFFCRAKSQLIYKNEIVDKVTGRRSTVDSRQIKRRNDELNDFYDNPINIYDRIWGVAQATMQNYSEIECLKINYGEVLRICFSDNLVDFVRNKKVIITSEIKEFHSGNIVEFIDGRKEQIDSIIFCTGYKNCLKYIDEKILQDIQFDYDNYLYPIIAYRGIYHKNHKNLLFVGMHNGIFWTGMELQARYATGLLSGKYEYPDEKKYEEVIEKETKYKDYQSKTKVKMTYPYVDYLETIANDMGVRPDLSKIKTEDYELYVALKTVLPIGVSYRINKEDPHMEENIKYLKRIAKEY